MFSTIFKPWSQAFSNLQTFIQLVDIGTKTWHFGMKKNMGSMFRNPKKIEQWLIMIYHYSGRTLLLLLLGSPIDFGWFCHINQSFFLLPFEKVIPLQGVPKNDLADSWHERHQRPHGPWIQKKASRVTRSGRCEMGSPVRIIKYSSNESLV